MLLLTHQHLVIWFILFHVIIRVDIMLYRKRGESQVVERQEKVAEEYKRVRKTRVAKV